MGRPRVKLALPRDAAALAALYTRTVHDSAARLAAQVEAQVAAMVEDVFRAATSGGLGAAVGGPEAGAGADATARRWANTLADAMRASSAQILDIMWARHANNMAHTNDAESVADMRSAVTNVQNRHIRDAGNAFDYLYTGAAPVDETGGPGAP